MNLKKRAIALFLSLMLLGSLGLSAFAADEGDTRVTLGADLNADEIAAVYKIFGVDRGQVEELVVTNADERAYLEGLVSDAAIGTRAISCTFLYRDNHKCRYCKGKSKDMVLNVHHLESRKPPVFRS